MLEMHAQIVVAAMGLFEGAAHKSSAECPSNLLSWEALFQLWVSALHAQAGPCRSRLREPHAQAMLNHEMCDVN